MLIAALICFSCIGAPVAKAEEIYYTEEDFPDLWWHIVFTCDENADFKLTTSELGYMESINTMSDLSEFSLKGIELLYNLSTLTVDNYSLKDLEGISELKNLQLLKIINCRLTCLPDLTELSNLNEIDFSGNHLTLKEIRSKLPSQFSDAECRAIADTQSPFYQEIEANGIVLSGDTLPDTVFEVNGSYISVSRFGEAYAPDAKLEFPKSDKVSGVYFNENEIDFEETENSIIIDFMGNGNYSIVTSENTTAEEITTEPVTEETTTEPISEETTTEPSSAETTTETTTETEATTTAVCDSPDTGDNSLIPCLSVFIITAAAILITAAGRKKARYN